MGMDESNAAIASADERLAAMQRQIESLGRVSGGFMDGADDQIGTINARDPQQYAQPLQIATGPSTGPIDFVNKPQAAAPDAGPTPVKEAKSHYDDYYRMAGVKAGEGAYTDLAPGDKTAHPLLQQFGLYDQQRHNRILQLADSQARIREMVDKAHQKKINDSINPKPDIGDPNVPSGIKPTMEQTMAGFSKPTFDLPDVSTPNSSPLYPENQTMPQPRGPMNDLQEALMASYVGGHLTQNNGNLEPTSLVAAQGPMLSPEAQEQEQRLQDENLKRYGLAPQEQPSQPGDDGAINLDPINVAATPLTYQPVPASVMNGRLQRQTAIAVKAGKRGELPRASTAIEKGADGSYYVIDKTTGTAKKVEGPSVPAGADATSIEKGGDGSYYVVNRNTGQASKVEGPSVPVDGQVEQLNTATQQLQALEVKGQGKSQQAKDLRNFITKLTTHQPASTVNVDLKQEAEFEKELGKKSAEQVIDSYKVAQDAAQSIDTTRQARKLLRSGMITGFGADAMVSAGQALRQLGINVGGTDIENSQAYAALTAQNVGKIIKQFGSGTGLSNADREYAEKMAGGRITLDKNALEKILDINERASLMAIRKHNRLVSHVKKTVVPLTVDEPQAESAGSLKDKSTDELLKMLQE